LTPGPQNPAGVDSGTPDPVPPLLQTAHKVNIYTQFENFSIQIFWEFMNLKKITRKINAL